MILSPVEALLFPDVFDDILAEDADVGHDGREDEHDAGEDPDREGVDALTAKYEASAQDRCQ